MRDEPAVAAPARVAPLVPPQQRRLDRPAVVVGPPDAAVASRLRETSDHV